MLPVKVYCLESLNDKFLISVFSLFHFILLVSQHQCLVSSRRPVVLKIDLNIPGYSLYLAGS